MKKCQFCAEEIQDEAVKCRHCGSMVAPQPEGAPPPEGPLQRSMLPMAAIAVIGALLVVIGVLLARRTGAPPAAVAAPVVTTEAASMAPGQPTSGDYQFLGIAWGTSRADVRRHLEARGFRFLTTDDEGDDQFEGRVDGRDAGVAAMYSGDTVIKFLVVLLTVDETGGLLNHFKRAITTAYGPHAEERGLATIWPERAGSLVWITTSDDHQIRVHYEAPGWPSESKKRKEGRTMGD